MRHATSLLVALAVALAACTAAPEEDGERIPGVRPGVTLPAPEARVAAPTDTVAVLGEQDRELGVPSFEGEVLVLNFWASWCGPCRAEQPELNDASRALADLPVSFLGVNIQDSEANALAHVREFDIPYPSLFDPANAYAARYKGVGPRSIPTTIVIDKQGRVAARLFGITTAIEVLALAERLAAE